MFFYFIIGILFLLTGCIDGQRIVSDVRRMEKSVLTNIGGVSVPADSRCPELLSHSRNLDRVAEGDAPDASQSLQVCINRTPERGTLSIPAGVYLIRSQVVVTKPIFLRTEGLTEGDSECGSPSNPKTLTGPLRDGRCAHLVAAPLFSQPFGILSIGIRGQGVDGVVIDHIVFDGNKEHRQTIVDRNCGNTAVHPQYTVSVWPTDGFAITKSAIVRSLCNSGLWISWSKSLKIEKNIFAFNGTHKQKHYADGLTVNGSDHSVIIGNLFVNNTDSDLMVASCTDCEISDNFIFHNEDFSGASNAAISTGTFKGLSFKQSDFTGTKVRSNWIDCGTLLGKENQWGCGFGIAWGQAPWSVYGGKRDVLGGSVSGNTIKNALIGLSVNNIRSRTDAGGIEKLYLSNNEVAQDSKGEGCYTQFDTFPATHGKTLALPYVISPRSVAHVLRPSDSNELDKWSRYDTKTDFYFRVPNTEQCQVSLK